MLLHGRRPRMWITVAAVMASVGRTHWLQFSAGHDTALSRARSGRWRVQGGREVGGCGVVAAAAATFGRSRFGSSARRRLRTQAVPPSVAVRAVLLLLTVSSATSVAKSVAGNEERYPHERQRSSDCVRSDTACQLPPSRRTKRCRPITTWCLPAWLCCSPSVSVTCSDTALNPVPPSAV